MTIGAKQIESLGNFLRSYEFTIPEYQRGYEWEADNVRSFHSTVLDARTHNRNQFIGTFILMTDPNADGEGRDQNASVVDGQQRLTTIFIYLSALRDIFHDLREFKLPQKGLSKALVDPKSLSEDLIFNAEKDDFRLKPNDLISGIFSDCVARDPEDGGGKTKKRKPLPKQHKKYTRKFRAAVRLIRQLLEEQAPAGAQGVERLSFYHDIYDSLINRLQVLAITSTNQTEALEIFMTMNTKGLSLGSSDIVKGMLFHAILSSTPASEAQATSDELLERWTQVVENLASTDIDSALRHYLLGRTGKKFQISGLPNESESFIKNGQLSPRDNAFQLLEDIVQMSEIYSGILNPAITDSNKTIRRYSEAMQCLNTINSSYRILMLVILNQVPSSVLFSEDQILEITTRVEAVVYRWQITGGNAQELEEVFRTLAYGIYSGSTTFEKVCAILEGKVMSDEDVKRAIERPVVDHRIARSMLFRIHQYLGDESRFLPFDTSKTDVEHIAPRTSTKEWEAVLGRKSNSEGSDDPSSYEYLAELIGNKTLLEEHINNRLKQKLFSDKVSGSKVVVKSREYSFGGYKNSKVDMTSDLAKTKEWTEQEILTRTSWLADCYLKIFSIPQRLGELVPFSAFEALSDNQTL